MKELIEKYFNLEQQIHDAFGYVEDWVTIPLRDTTEFYWTIEQNDNGSGTVRYAKDEKMLKSDDGDYYQDSIYTQRFLPKFVYETDEYTMVAVDTHVDGNKYMSIFSNKLKR